MKAQSGTEFLVMFSLVLLVLAFSVYIYSVFMEQGSALRTNLEAHAVCNQVASALSSISAYNANITYSFSLPDNLNYNDYTVYAVSTTRYIKVDYGIGGAGCYIATSRISNSSGSTFFQIAKNASIASNRGEIVVYP